MASESIECPDCGATIESEEQMEVKEVKEIRERPKGGIGYGEETENLYLCRKCKSPLGIRRRTS